MAKQNFIAGGYYGKLGATVGQRWKNKRTIRIYVVPFDPKTPAQMAGRQKFGQAVPLAQVGMRMNKGAPCWQREDLTEWQYRMSTAKRRIDAGVEYPLTIPLYPDGYSPQFVVDQLTLTRTSPTHYKCTSTSYTDFGTNRELIVVLLCTNTVTGDAEEYTAYAHADPQNASLFEFDLPGYLVLEEGATIYGVSTDDAENNDEMVSIPLQYFDFESVLVIDDWTYTYNTNGTIFLDSDKLSAAQSAHTFRLSLTMVNGETGEQVVESQDVVTTPNSGRVTLPARFAGFVFWTGGQINGIDITTGSVTEQISLVPVGAGSATRRELDTDLVVGTLTKTLSYESDFDGVAWNVELAQNPTLAGGQFSTQGGTRTVTINGTQSTLTGAFNITGQSITGTRLEVSLVQTYSNGNVDNVLTEVALTGCKIENVYLSIPLSDVTISATPDYVATEAVDDWTFAYNENGSITLTSAKLARARTAHTIELSPEVRNGQTGSLEIPNTEVTSVPGNGSVTLPTGYAKYVFWTGCSVGGSDETTGFTKETLTFPRITLGSTTRRTLAQGLVVGTTSVSDTLACTLTGRTHTVRVTQTDSLIFGEFSFASTQDRVTVNGTQSTQTVASSEITQSVTAGTLTADFTCTASSGDIDNVQATLIINTCYVRNQYLNIPLGSISGTASPTFPAPINLTDWTYSYDANGDIRIISTQLAMISNSARPQLRVTFKVCDTGSNATRNLNVASGQNYVTVSPQTGALYPVMWSDSKVEVIGTSNARPVCSFATNLTTVGSATRRVFEVECPRPSSDAGEVEYTGDDVSEHTYEGTVYQDLNVLPPAIWTDANVSGTLTLNLRYSGSARTVTFTSDFDDMFEYTDGDDYYTFYVGFSTPSKCTAGNYTWSFNGNVDFVLGIYGTLREKNGGGNYNLGD